MGKAAILLVLGSSLILSLGIASKKESEYNLNLTDAGYQEQVVAREMAESALEVIVGRVKREYKTFRGSYTDRTYKNAKYDMSATDEPDSSISVTARGMVGRNEYFIRGTIVKRYGRVLDALTFEGVHEDVSFNSPNKMMISGIDRKTDGLQNFLGSPGEGVDVHGASVKSGSSFADFWNNAEVENVEGILGEGDIVNEDSVVDLQLLADQIMAYTGINRITYNESASIDKNNPLGSRAEPAIVVANADFTMKNQSSGVGVLLVYGDLRIQAGTRFEGLILVMGDGNEVWVGGNVEIYGALALQSNDAKDSAIELRMGGDSRIQYSSEALMRLGAFVPRLHEDNNSDFVFQRISEKASVIEGAPLLRQY